MFKWVNIGLRATSTRMGWGVEKKCGESPANRLRSMWMGTQPQGGGAAAGWALGALRAIPRPFPTADSAPPSLSHPQHSHTTPTTQPHPTATLLHHLPSPSLPHPPHVQQRKSFTFASQLCRSFSGTITPLGGLETRSKSLSSAGICCTPQPPQPHSTAWLGAKGLPISHPGVHGCHQGTVSSLAEGSQDCTVYGPPCGEHTETPRPREMKGPARVALPGLSHPHLPWLIFLSTKRAYTSSSKASLS